MQSVISESEKESLNNAMSMMGHQELELVEEEVRKIQNNVRGWLLRKNYINLREAARSLQLAWRERRRSGHSQNLSHSSSTSSTGGNAASDRSGGAGSASTTGSQGAQDGSPMTSTLLIHPSEASAATNDINRTAFDSEHSSKEERDKAAATLQAATRRMIARRKSFSHLRKQTMASLTIQRNLVKWWTHARSSSGRGGMMAILEAAGEDALAMDDSL